MGQATNTFLRGIITNKWDECNFGGSFEIICNFGGFVVILVGPEKNVVIIVGPL